MGDAKLLQSTAIPGSICYSLFCGLLFLPPALPIPPVASLFLTAIRSAGTAVAVSSAH